MANDAIHIAIDPGIHIATAQATLIFVAAGSVYMSTSLAFRLVAILAAGAAAILGIVSVELTLDGAIRYLNVWMAILAGVFAGLVTRDLWGVRR
jgi:hypothetical protein